MKLMNVLIVVEDMERSKKFYDDVFGLKVVREVEGKAILMDGLVLQDKKTWCECIGREITGEHNASLLYFEEKNIASLIEKLEQMYPTVKYLNKRTTYSWGQQVVRFYDFDGHLIEVRTPISEMDSPCSNEDDFIHTS